MVNLILIYFNIYTLLIYNSLFLSRN